MLLAGRVRHDAEADEVREVLEAAFRCKLDPQRIFTLPSSTTSSSEASRRHRIESAPVTWSLLKQMTSSAPNGFESIVWTYNMRRMTALVEQALRFSEPVLLVGETGYEI